jgi:ATP-dependent DNA helicase DinG
MIKAAGGRTLLLTTSNADMERFAEKARAELPFPVLMQGDAPKPVLIEQFTRNESTVLIATTSFWTGVDVPGTSLSQVIITKIPFPPPR